LVSLLLGFVLLQFSTYFALAGTVEEEGGFARLEDLMKVFGNILSVVATLGGFASFVMVIIGGFKYITAQGDPKAIAAARQTITWAIAGLVFIILAWLILLFIEMFTGVPVTIFKIG